MSRFQTIKDKLTGSIESIVDHVPRVGADFAFEIPCPMSGPIEDGPTSRNRWSRPDLVSAIGHDPHEGDSEEAVWPPATR
jgi:hypothetical protein